MSGTFELEKLREIACSSLFITSGIYKKRSNGDIQFDGSRPGPDWHAHGYFSKKLWVLIDGKPVPIVLWKARWLLPKTGKTLHSRPPDDFYAISTCSLILFLKLFTWLDSTLGFQSSKEIVSGLETIGSQRTVSRWLQKLLKNSMDIQQAIRLTIIERCEPRPFENLFSGGLSPPKYLNQRHWKTPKQITILWRAFTMLFGSAITLDTPASILLAEAHGRLSITQNLKK